MNKTVVPLYPQEYPQVIPDDKKEVVDEGGRIRYVHYPTLTVYLPEKPAGCGIVVCPGGGYWLLAAKHEGREIAEMLNSMGVAAFILKYRLPPDYPHPMPLNDAQRAIRMVRANADKWGVKPDRVGILGFSAGGHLASTAATHFDSGRPHGDEIDRQSCRPDFAVLCYPVITFTQPYCHAGSRAQLIGPNAAEEMRTYLSSELQVTSETCPTFLFHSQDDKGVDPRNSIDFFLACTRNNVKAELHLFPTGGHGFGLGQPGSSEAQWPTLMQRWLDNLGMLKG